MVALRIPLPIPLRIQLGSALAFALTRRFSWLEIIDERHTYTDNTHGGSPMQHENPTWALGKVSGPNTRRLPPEAQPDNQPTLNLGKRGRRYREARGGERAGATLNLGCGGVRSADSFVSMWASRLGLTDVTQKLRTRSCLNH